MSYVVINALSVPDGQGAELEARFAARKHSFDAEPGYVGFQLLRPTAGESRYFVVTTWETREDFTAWQERRASGGDAHGHGRPAGAGASAEGGSAHAAAAPAADSHSSAAGAHGGAEGAPAKKPVATGSELLEFETVDLEAFGA
ncbi:antibiotic biosynthesis monooxygenase [Leucobacter sp. UCMA 4100]|uniref:antibiotic biosynthesis monooxygenase family protein n=1 Tax=Leucobacter sp. UCMA 4100 TaxID=2810534 RepID=UPI002A42DF24|nr:antibiotic biosynthesis monooxygenase [Leucobacter sp. UCMA 4100]